MLLYDPILVLILNHNRSIADRIGAELSLYTLSQKTKHQIFIHNFTKYFSILTNFSLTDSPIIFMFGHILLVLIGSDDLFV